MSVIPESLIRYYDGMGWIPTIRGCLSLDLIDDADCILGDVDKYSIRFKTINGFRSEHYLIASSLLTVNDNKGGINFDRTSRYIFTGTINSEKEFDKFLNKHRNNQTIKGYNDKEGLLIGHLIIIASEDSDSKFVLSHKLNDSEVELLEGFKELNRLNEEFQRLFYIEAASMQTLQEKRMEMLKKWQELNGIAMQISEVEDSKRTIFSFEVALTRDGILLLKNVSKENYRKYYADPGTADDYKKNIPLHRLFKSAMNYVKYLFHSNYHHVEDHDTFLPASNLHPAKSLGQLDLYGVFRHQLDAFLVPLIKQKRNSFTSHTVEPKGIILYAKAFISVFESNELVSTDVAKKAKEHCELLQKEIEQMTAKHNTIINALITQHNPFVIISGLLAFVFTCLKTIDTLGLKVEHFSFLKSFSEIPQPSYGVVKFLIFAFIGFVIYIIPRSITLKKQFRPKRKLKHFAWWQRLRNSNLKSRRFSWIYDLTIHFQTLLLIIKHCVRKDWRELVFPILYSIVIAILLTIAIVAFIKILTTAF